MILILNYHILLLILLIFYLFFDTLDKLIVRLRLNITYLIWSNIIFMIITRLSHSMKFLSSGQSLVYCINFYMFIINNIQRSWRLTSDHTYSIVIIINDRSWKSSLSLAILIWKWVLEAWTSACLWVLLWLHIDIMMLNQKLILLILFHKSFICGLRVMASIYNKWLFLKHRRLTRCRYSSLIYALIRYFNVINSHLMGPSSYRFLIYLCLLLLIWF